jgi:hypothetical protein
MMGQLAGMMGQLAGMMGQLAGMMGQLAEIPSYVEGYKLFFRNHASE